jgi:hypothetical protein
VGERRPWLARCFSILLNSLGHWQRKEQRGRGGGEGGDDEGEKGEGTRAMRVRRNRGGGLWGRAEARRVRKKTCKKQT